MVSVAIPHTVLVAAEKAGEIRLRLEVAAATPGGLAVYGERFGRYPLDPTLVFVMKPCWNDPASKLQFAVCISSIWFFNFFTLKKTTVAITTTLVLLFLRASLLAQCAMGGESVPDGPSPGGGNYAAGFSWGVLAMLGVLAVLITGLVSLVVYIVRSEGISQPSPSE